RIIQTGVLALLIWCLLLPVRLSVLAPVEIVPRKPFLVTSKMDGVIDTVPVQPNQGVKTDQLLFRLDDTVSRNNYEVTRKSLAVIEAEYNRTRQKAFMDDESRARILYLKARIEQKSAEVAYLADVLKQGEVRAERDGIVVFSDVNDWLGKPVVTGEKVMSIADPGQVEAEVLLPVADAINLEPGADVLIFLNVAPDRPLLATLRQASYEAAITPEGVLSFRLKVTIDPGESVPRIGLRGTAKLYGKEVTVFYYLMRRPLIAIRQTLGV
ncbi:MAG: HlyD family efflux transporter periplasmic adaptor subunit, partial [Desulfobulbaceae bacterium]|nr:HlyD family efflux transporter periplasmic adaptor subunit [Desulfobulbaceae bacterium]